MTPGHTESDETHMRVIQDSYKSLSAPKPHTEYQQVTTKIN